MKVTLYHSVKWVGLFVTALVGLYTIEDLWDKFGDLKMTVVRSHESCSGSSHLICVSSATSADIGQRA